MKKRVLIALLVAILAMSIIAPAASAAQIGTFTYVVSTDTLTMRPDNTQTFTITIPKPTGTSSAYCGVEIRIQVPNGASIVDAKYNKNGTVMSVFPLKPLSDGSYMFYNSGSSNTFSDDMICTVTVSYSGAGVTALTISGITQVIRGANRYDTRVSVNQASVQLYPNSISPTDATLSNLSVSPGAFTEAFNSSKTSYTVNAAYNVDKITVTAVANDSRAKVTGAGVKSLELGENAVEVTVTAADGTTQKTYTIKVNKADENDKSDATLSRLSISSGKLYPDFATLETSYAAVVANNVSSIIITADQNDPRAKVEGAGQKPLSVGVNSFVVTVTSADETAKKEYKIEVTRLDETSVPYVGGTVDAPDTDPPTAGSQFSDVKDSKEWYYDAVYYVANAGLMKGTSEDLFSPNTPVTRAMFVTTLGRLAEKLGDRTTGFSNPFNDVPADQWYSQYIAWAADKGIVLGYSELKFGLNDLVTREQMATFMIRFCDYYKIELGSDISITFSDAGSISGWAKDFVGRATAAGLMQGSSGQFRPRGTATRAQVAQVIMNFMETYLK